MTKNKKIEQSDPNIQRIADDLRKEGLTYDNTGAPMDFVSAVNKLSSVGKSALHEDELQARIDLVKSSRESKRKIQSKKDKKATKAKVEKYIPITKRDHDKNFANSLYVYTDEYGVLTQRHNVHGEQYDEYILKLKNGSLSEGEKIHMLSLEKEMEDIEEEQKSIKNEIDRLKTLADIEHTGLENLTNKKTVFSTPNLYGVHTDKDGTLSGEQRLAGKARKSQARLAFEQQLQTVGVIQSQYLESYKNHFEGKSLINLKYNSVLEGLGIRSKDKVKALKKERLAYQKAKDSLIADLKYELTVYQDFTHDQAERIAKKYIDKVLTIENINNEEKKVAFLRKESIDNRLEADAQKKQRDYETARGVKKAKLWLDRNKVRIAGKVASGSIALLSGVGAGAWALRAVAGSFGGYYGGKLGRNIGQKLGKKYFNNQSGRKVEKIIASYSEGHISISEYQKKLEKLGLNANRVTALCAIAGGVGGALEGAKLEGFGYDIAQHYIHADAPVYHQEVRGSLHEHHAITHDQRVSAGHTTTESPDVPNDTLENPDPSLLEQDGDKLNTLTVTVKDGKGLISMFQDAHDRFTAEYVHDGEIDASAPEGVKSFLAKSPVEWAQESGGYDMSADATGGNGLESILVQKGATLDIDTHTGSIIFHNGADTQIIEDGDISTPVTTLEGKFMDTNHTVDIDHSVSHPHVTIDRGNGVETPETISSNSSSPTEHSVGAGFSETEHVDPHSVFEENAGSVASDTSTSAENFNDLTSSLAKIFSIQDTEAYTTYMKNVFTSFDIYSLDIAQQELFARTYTAVVDNLFGYDLPTGEHVSGFESNTWFNIKGASLEGIYKTIDNSTASGEQLTESAYTINEFFRKDPDVKIISYIQNPPPAMSLETACARLALGEK
ncbi:MAG: hypothetical protein KBB88_03255 [Candidatus Pacebacteria bacterium]|nr:hypothetical protein [Candidatus Paceibacterota bacterium]